MEVTVAGMYFCYIKKICREFQFLFYMQEEFRTLKSDSDNLYLRKQVSKGSIKSAMWSKRFI